MIFVLLTCVAGILIFKLKSSPFSEDNSNVIYSFGSMDIGLIKVNENNQVVLEGQININITLKVDLKTRKRFDDSKIILRNLLNSLISSKSIEDLNDPDPDKLTDKKTSLKQHIKKELEKAIPDCNIFAVYFTEYFVN